MAKLTRDDLTNRVECFRFFYDGTLTICVITLYSGFKLVGHSACMDEADYVKSTGEDIAFERALEQLWELEGYRRLTGNPCLN